jgi:hypothetical protein
MRTDFSNTRLALQSLKDQSLPDVVQANEAYGEAKMLTDLKKAEVDSSAYVREADESEYKSFATPAEVAALQRGREKVLTTRALADAKKMIAEHYDGDPLLGEALIKMPTSGLDVLKIVSQASKSETIPTALRDKLANKLGLDEGEADRLLSVFHDLGGAHLNADKELFWAQTAEFKALVTQFAASLATAVEGRLKDGTLDTTAYDSMMADFERRVPRKYEFNPEGRLDFAAGLELNCREDGPISNLHRGIVSLLEAIKTDLSGAS